MNIKIVSLLFCFFCVHFLTFLSVFGADEDIHWAGVDKNRQNEEALSHE